MSLRRMPVHNLDTAVRVEGRKQDFSWFSCTSPSTVLLSFKHSFSEFSGVFPRIYIVDIFVIELSISLLQDQHQQNHI
uniref:Uncharacterized protein n=1 Tax=Magallana gigas TaxID=29159 RepID=K1PYI3_MAGGI